MFNGAFINQGGSYNLYVNAVIMHLLLSKLLFSLCSMVASVIK